MIQGYYTTRAPGAAPPPWLRGDRVQTGNQTISNPMLWPLGHYIPILLEICEIWQIMSQISQIICTICQIVWQKKCRICHEIYNMSNNMSNNIQKNSSKYAKMLKRSITGISVIFCIYSPLTLLMWSQKSWPVRGNWRLLRLPSNSSTAIMMSLPVHVQVPASLFGAFFVC